MSRKVTTKSFAVKKGKKLLPAASELEFPTIPEAPEPPQPSPSSSVGRIPYISLSPPNTSPNSKFHEKGKKQEYDGGLVFPVDFKLGECEKVIDHDGKCTQIFPKIQKSDEWLTSGKDERIIEQMGDRLCLYRGDTKRYLYTKWGFVSPEVKRKDYTIYLRETGILQVIAKFLISLEKMSFRPPPEEVISVMVKSISAQFFVRTSFDEMIDYRDGLKANVEKQIQENEILRQTLENYGPIFKAYEVLNPDDFSELIPGKRISSHKEVAPAIEPSHVVESVDLVKGERKKPHSRRKSRGSHASADGHHHHSHHDNPEEEHEEMAATDNEKLYLEQRKASLEERRKKYAELLSMKRHDLDVASLAQHFKNEKIGMKDSVEELMDSMAADHEKVSDRCIGNLPIIEMIGGTHVVESADFKLPPRILNEHLKYLGGTLVNISPPGTNTIRDETDEEEKEEEDEEYDEE